MTSEEAVEINYLVGQMLLEFERAFPNSESFFRQKNLLGELERMRDCIAGYLLDHMEDVKQ